jgi:hypothetical protein
MADLYDLSFDDILDYLEELGERLDINTNEHMQWARELTYDATPLPRVLVDNGYSGVATHLTSHSTSVPRQATFARIEISRRTGWSLLRLRQAM